MLATRSRQVFEALKGSRADLAAAHADRKAGSGPLAHEIDPGEWLVRAVGGPSRGVLNRRGRGTCVGVARLGCGWSNPALLVRFADDRQWIRPQTKIAGQSPSPSAAALRPHWLPPAAAIPVGALVLVASINSFNFLDNIDGLAAGTAGIAAAALAVVSLSTGGEVLRVLACAVAGTCLGFLPLNFRPRRPAALFMGMAARTSSGS